MTREEILAMLDAAPRARVDFDGIHSQIELWAKTAPLEIPSLLEELSVRGWAEHPVAGIVDFCERALAITPGIATAEIAFSLAELPFMPARGETFHSAARNARNRLREMARRLGSAQPADVLLELLERNEEKDEHFELLCLLVQEMVVADKASGQEVLRRLELEMRGRGHPLGALPLHRLSIESAIALPSYGYRGWSYGSWARPSPEKDARASTGSRAGWRVRDVTADDDPELVLSAIHDIQIGTGGNFEVKSFGIEGAESPSGRQPRPKAEGAIEGTPADDVSLVASLPLDCLAGAHEMAFIHPYEPHRVFANLFGLAASGAEYSHGEGGAYGRLYAWHALAGMTGVRPDVPLEAIEARAHACSWTWFEADSDFFEQVINDLGIACRRPEGTVSVLAASTTD